MFHFRANMKNISSLNTFSRDFWTSPPFKELAYFMCQSREILNAFNSFTSKQVSRKSKIFSKKLEYRFSVESTALENVTFSYKTCQSKASVKTNRMWSIKWTNHQEQGFSANYFLFRKFYFIIRTPFKELIYCTNYPNVHI